MEAEVGQLASEFIALDFRGPQQESGENSLGPFSPQSLN